MKVREKLEEFLHEEGLIRHHVEFSHVLETVGFGELGQKGLVELFVGVNHFVPLTVAVDSEGRSDVEVFGRDEVNLPKVASLEHGQLGADDVVDGRLLALEDQVEILPGILLGAEFEQWLLVDGACSLYFQKKGVIKRDRNGRKVISVDEEVKM